MIKTLKIFLFLLAVTASAAVCRPIQTDSLQKIKQANIDARHFKLDDAAWKQYKHSLPETSDYFKPRAADAKFPAMLNDSAYVSAYRDAAYRKNKGRHTAVIFGADITTVVVIAALIGAAIFAGPKVD